MIKLLKFIPIQLTLFLIFGILTGSFYNFQPNTLIIIFSIFLLLISVVYVVANIQFKPTSLFAVLVYTLSFFIGIASITFKNQLNKKQHYSNDPSFETGKPIPIIISIQKVLKPNSYYHKYEAAIIQLNSNKTIGKILVNIEKDSVENYLKVDDKLIVKTVFSEIQKPFFCIKMSR